MAFKAFLFAIEKVVLPKLGESFLSKVADNAINNVNNIKDFERTVTTLKDNLKSLGAKASDVEDQIKTAELSGKKKRKREVEEWLRQVKSIDAEWAAYCDQPEGLMRRLEDGGRAAQLNLQVQKLFEQSWNFGELLLDVCGTGRVTLLTTEMVGEAFQKNLEKIWRLLETGEKLSIALHGMGGAGKTTLAMHIHNLLVEQSPGGVFWVTVSQGINTRILQDKIAHSVGVNLSEMDDIKIRAGKLHDALSKMNNPVLILDDVWENIDLLEVGCVISKECCRLIITTRSLGVCRQIGCEERIAVETLNEREAWKLFSETLGEETKLDDLVEETAKSVAKLCDGLPLGIITVAGSMRGETEEYAWRHTSVELKNCVVGGDDRVFNVLKYSFDRLHKHGVSERSEFNLFQRCFLYCSLYPEDYEIPIEGLVGNLISEGFVKGGKSRREQVYQGHVIVDHLVKVCLLETCVHYNGCKCVKMHDLVRGMALKIGGGKYMVRAGDRSLKEIPMEQDWTEQLEKVSLMRNYITRIEEGTSPNCPNLSTLLLNDNSNLQCISDQFFWRMQGLRTLDLSCTGISKLSNSISELKSLEALRLNGCSSLSYVPSLRNLKLLRELDLTRTLIEDVPEGVGELIKLKFLSLAGTRLKVLPRGLLLKLVDLQVLTLSAHVRVAKEDIQNLKLLEEFSGGVENVGDFNSFIRSRVHDHTLYSIQVGSIGESKYTFENVDEKRVVVLTGCNLKDEEVVLGQDIKRLTLSSCEGLSNCLLDDLPRLNNPTSLTRLEIESCGGIECILRREPQLSSGFSTLEKIKLTDLRDLKGVVEIGGTSVVVFPSLRELRIDRCKEMRRLGLSLSELPKLVSLYISDCSEIEEIFKDESGRKKEEIGGAPQLVSSLRDIQIEGCSKVRRLGISVLEVPNLELLKTEDCSEIGGTSVVVFPSLRDLRIVRCKKMRRLGLSPSEFPKLKSLFIWKCSEIEEIFKDESGRKKEEILFSSLRRIKIIECGKVRRLGISVLEVPKLEEIVITECLEIEEIFEDDQGISSGVVPLPKLTDLCLSGLPSLKSVCKAPIISNSICSIYINECPELMKKMPLHFDDPPPPSLIEIDVCREWWESLEWDNPNLPNLLLPFLNLIDTDTDTDTDTDMSVVSS